MSSDIESYCTLSLIFDHLGKGYRYLEGLSYLQGKRRPAHSLSELKKIFDINRIRDAFAA